MDEEEKYRMGKLLKRKIMELKKKRIGKMDWKFGAATSCLKI